jgi:hypothetical protein
VKGGAGTRSYPKDLSVCPVADMRSGVAFSFGEVSCDSFGEVSCRIHCIERNVVVIWRPHLAEECRAIAALCTPSTEMRTHYSRMSERYSSLAEAEDLGMLAYGR